MNALDAFSANILGFALIRAKFLPTAPGHSVNLSDHRVLPDAPRTLLIWDHRHHCYSRPLEKTIAGYQMSVASSFA